MQWPSRAEYTEAVRDYPHVSLQDPELTGGEPRRGRDNFVVSDTGAFSIVFPIETVSTTFALRCWVKDVSNAKDQYKKISAYLEQVRLPYFVDFEYVPQGILVQGTVYPITRMEWIDGVSLREFIEQNLQAPHIFKVVAIEFQKMVAILHQHQISHGDLQDGNILIRQNGANVELKLIDYDSLFVPALQGQPEEIVGLPEYQHPQRIASGGKAREKVDYFSELVIYLSFLGLSERPDLWTQFGNEKRVNRGLLFSKSDFKNPDQSNIFQELANLSPDVQQLATTLKDFCAQTSIDQLKPLETILPKSASNPITDLWRYVTDTLKNSKHLPHLWQYITDALKGNWHFFAAGTLGSALVICFIAFLIQMNAKEASLSQNAVLTKQIAQRELKIQDLTSSIQTLENTNEELNRVNGELRKELRSKNSVTNATSRNMASLQRQLNEQKDKNRALQRQIDGSKSGTIDQDATIKRLTNEKTETLTKNRNLQKRLTDKTSEAKNLTDRVQQLQAEKIEIQRQNQKLRSENEVLTRQNQGSRDKHTALRDQQNKTNQMDADTVVGSEPLKEIQNVTSGAGSHNNQGVIAFNRRDYNKAIAHFRTAIKTDSKFAIAHYNIGCTYLKTKEFSEAISAFSEAITIDPEFKEAYYNLGFAHLRSGARKEAKRSTERAIEIEPDYRLAQNLLKVIENTQQ